MKTLTVIRYFGGGRGAKTRIAKALSISTAAVSKWPEDGDVPNGSAHRLSIQFPELFQLELGETAAHSTNQSIKAA